MKKILEIFGAIILLALIGIVVFFFYKYKHINIPRPERGVIKTESAFTLPDGFKMSTFAEAVTGARVLAFDSKGTILVSQPGEGKISALPDLDNDGKADKIVTVASGLNGPHGLAFKCDKDVCKLYVAEKNQLDIFDYDAITMKASNKKKLLGLPGGDGLGHSTRTLLFMPSPNQDTLLVAIGSSCNVCIESDPNRASILSYNIVTGKSQQFAKGLRNSVFMDINPVSGAIWATEMGRDGLGDDVPPDEINILQSGKNYGWPNCYGQNIHDTDFDKKVYIRNPCMEPYETASHVDLQAHSAPLGLAFVPEEGWSETYWYNLLVAYHGSWNRSVPTGYKIERIKLDAKGKYLGSEDFITGWLTADGKKIGRPVDIKVMPGGTIYISDDGAGKIYKVVYYANT